MKARSRYGSGSIVFERNKWRFLQWVDGKRVSRTIGSLQELPTKNAAWRAADLIRRELPQKPAGRATAPTVSALVEQYRVEKMPRRIDTRRAYESYLRNQILPAWGDSPLTDLQARPVELWLQSLELAPKSRAHVRGLLRTLWKFAMWSDAVPAQTNPMTLVSIKDVSQRTRKPRSLTVEEFQRLSQHLDEEPFRTIALLCVCLGLRISECLALRWSDLDWLNGKLLIERGIVRQHVDQVKTAGSERSMSIDSNLLAVLKVWKQQTQFPAQEDWIFASPIQLGRLPWSYVWVWRVFQKAATAAGIGKIGTHTMRHTYRSWLDAVGTGLAVQQKLMRHRSITTTMDTYGTVITGEMEQANSKVVDLALARAPMDRTNGSHLAK